MSYILDALRRADAERQRGAVPGLHAQPLSAALAHGGPDRAAVQRRRWRVGGWAAAAVLVLGAALLWMGAGPPRPPPALPLAGGPVSNGSVISGPVTSVPMPPSLPPVAAVAPRQTAPQPTPLSLPPPPPLPAPQAAPQPAVQPAGPAPTARLATPALPLAAAPPAAARTAASAAAAAQPLPTLAELPEATRRGLPALVVGGSMYAEQAPLRIVILNGQVVHEGDRLAPDLLVQQIRLKSVVLNFRGQLFEIGF